MNSQATRAKPTVSAHCAKVSGRLSRILQATLLAIASAALLAACGSPTALFNSLLNVPPDGKDPGAVAVVHQPRRLLSVEREQIVVTKEYLADLIAAQKAGPPPDWPAVFKRLPKDDEENIDWNRALIDQVIAPRPGIDVETPEIKVIDLDVTLSTSGKPERMVIFSHASHGQWLACSNCHPAIFAKEEGNAKITMDLIDEGKYCGVCHDKVALAMPANCKGCHKVTRPSKKS